MSIPTSASDRPRDVALLEQQLECYRQKLAVVDESLHHVLGLPRYRRSRCLLAFLWKTHAMYKFAIAELEQVLEARGL